MAACIRCKIDNIAKSANSVNNDGSELKFGSPDGGDDGEYNGNAFVEISRILASQGAFFIVAISKMLEMSPFE